MGMLSRINATVFAVPLALSALLLRLLNTVRHSAPRQRAATHRRRAPAPAPDATLCEAAEPSTQPEAVAKAMRRELRAVLDAHEGSREVFRYLAHFEHRFAKSGLETLELMAPERLRRALAQFEAIVTNWSEPNLADLRSRMAVAVAERDSGRVMWAPAATLSKAYAPREMPMLARTGRAGGAAPAGRHAHPQVEVSDDISISRFQAAFREWHPSQQEAMAAILKGAAAR
ncbi:MAG: hypothetical protein ABI156_05655 [Caldimonas sp.]